MSSHLAQRYKMAVNLALSPAGAKTRMLKATVPTPPKTKRKRSVRGRSVEPVGEAGLGDHAAVAVVAGGD
jgi:hypothetical protein